MAKGRKQNNAQRLVASTETQDQVKGALLLDIVIGKGTPIFELLAGKDQSLLVGWNSLLVLNLRLDVVNRVRGLDLQRNGFAREGLDEDLHATTETKDKVESRLFLDVVVRESTTVLKLLSSKDETLLVGRNALLVLDFH